MARINEKILLGCHVSNSGSEMLLGSVKEALKYKANCFMVYLGPPQNTNRKEASLLHIEEMKEELEKNNINIENVIIHAPYILNLAQSNEDKRSFAIRFLSSEMKTMAAVGAKYIVVHPGAHMHLGEEVGLELIADSLRQVLENTNYDNTYIALETMSGKGTECGKNFEEIHKIIELLDNNNRIVCCLDTCHINDAGYDIVKNYEDVIEKFDQIIGLDRLKIIHLNDSKNPCGSHKDRHENIGLGCIGFKTLMKFVTDERFINIPKILETPYVKVDGEEYPPYMHEIEMIRNKKFDKELINNIVSYYKNN